MNESINYILTYYSLRYRTVLSEDVPVTYLLLGEKDFHATVWDDAWLYSTISFLDSFYTSLKFLNYL